MVCPKCNKESENNICNNCKEDIILINKILNISNKYYNKGLKKAKKRNFEEAIELLKLAVKYNNKNIEALNILGLCYYATGEIGSAAKYWVKSCFINNDAEENLAVNYLKKVENKLTKREKLNDSLKMYNHALEHMKRKSDDVAIIQLKKAVEINPNFVEALNLLTLCYLVQGNNTKAISTAKQVLEIDKSNEKATKYYNSLMASRESKIMQISQPKEQLVKSQSNKKSNILSFLLGGVTIGLITYFLILPTIYDKNTKKVNDLFNKSAITAKSYTDELGEIQNENVKLKKELEKIQNESKTNFIAFKEEEAKRLLKEASNLNFNKDYIGAGAVISTIDENYIEVSDIGVYKAIKDESYLNAGQLLFTKGVKEYDRGEHEKSIESLQKSLYYSKESTDYYDDALFYMGRNCEMLGDNVTAKKFYTDLVEKYPDSNVYQSGKSRLNIING